MNDRFLISKVKTICKKKPNERTNAELQELQELTKNSKIFKTLTEANGESAHLLCCKYLVYEYCEGEAYLFKAGELGTRFYIIISGLVGVEISVKDSNGESKTIEVVRYGKGGSFGELALETSKPRAASIWCKVPTHFIALEKLDYNRMMAKFVSDKRNNTVSFLQALPIFSNTTKGSLAKLTYNFREKEYSHGKVVYNEGDDIGEVYIIIEGEFLFQKKIKVEDGRKRYGDDLEIYTERSEIRKHRAKHLNKQLVQIANVAKLGVGELFGIEEEIEMHRKYTCVSNSGRSKVLSISKADFVKRVRGEDIAVYIIHRNIIKDHEINERASMWKFIAEDKASSLSPIQLRKQHKFLNRNQEHTPKPPPTVDKSSSIPIFSKRIQTQPSEYLQKFLSIDLKKLGSKPHSQHLTAVPSTISHTHYPSDSSPSQKIISLERSLQKTTLRSISPLTRSEDRPGLALYSMNSRHIFDALQT